MLTPRDGTSDMGGGSGGRYFLVVVAGVGDGAIASFSMSRTFMSPSGGPSSRATTLTSYLALLSDARVFSLWFATEP